MSMTRWTAGVNQGSQYGNHYFLLYPEPEKISDLAPQAFADKKSSIILPELWAVLLALVEEGDDKAFHSFGKTINAIPNCRTSSR